MSGEGDIALIGLAVMGQVNIWRVEIIEHLSKYPTVLLSRRTPYPAVLDNRLRVRPNLPVTYSLSGENEDRIASTAG